MLLIINKTLLDTINAFSHLCFFVIMLTDVCTGLICLIKALISLKENIAVLYEYKTVLASHLVNPLIVPPDILRKN